MPANRLFISEHEHRTRKARVAVAFKGEGWIVDSDGITICDCDPKGQDIPISADQWETDRAQFIVTACNAHFALVETLDGVLKQIRASEHWWIDCKDRSGFDREAIEFALALARNKTKS